MAKSENKNQHTLYRFVSLRNPELSKKKDQNKRFVFYNEQTKGGFFISKMLPLVSTENKWTKLLATANNFEGTAFCIKSKEDLATIFVNTDFLEYSN